MLRVKRQNGSSIMALILSSEAYDRLEQKFGKEGAKEIVNVLDASLQAVDKKVDDTLEGLKDKADFLITQKKFELKDELTKELATKSDIVRLEGEIRANKVELDRKFTIMFLILLFTTIFLNQNALKFIAELFGLIKP
jgi:hypothetical protein